VSALLGRMPSAVGIPAELEHGKSASCRSASPPPSTDRSHRCRRFTCLPMIIPIRRRPRRFSHLDATTNLSRQIVERGILSGGGSAGQLFAHSRSANCWRGALQHRAPRGQGRVCNGTRTCRTSSRFWGSKELSDEDKQAVGAREKDREIPLAAPCSSRNSSRAWKEST